MEEKLEDIESRVIAKPIESYEDFHARLSADGLNAPFPEFKPVVDYLVQELHSDYFQNVIAAHADLKYELNEVLTFLTHINLKFTNQEGEAYPYEIPFAEPFPYRPTIDAIESAIRLLDKLNRLAPDNKAVQLYHFDRYCYHRHSLVSSHEVILVPTLKELSLVDFIRTRAVPIEFIGVISKTARADGHQQSPLDFWYHDLNHARRLYAYLKRKEKEQGVQSDKEKLAYYKKMNAFIHDTIIPNLVDIPEHADEEERALRLLATMIIFEIVHETALTLETDEIVKDMLRGNGPQPFEFMKSAEASGKPVDIETLRTPTGNIQSGASITKKDPNETLEVTYFFDPTSIGLLANVYSKLNHMYYDDGSAINENVVPAAYRKPEHIVKAAKKIFSVLGVTEYPSDEELLDLVLNREGTKERNLAQALYTEGEQDAQIATDPISADEIIAQIKGLNKKICTLFGYSALEYEDKANVLASVRGELEKLDPASWIVNIGATEDGIGAAYEIAKNMGFHTIGIVSTQALSYSGRFSPFVEKIYIVNDANWGGYVPDSHELAETTKAYLAVSDTIAAFGGGENTAVILREAKKRGIPLSYAAADMNHEKALRGKKSDDMDFKGAAYKVWQELKD